MTIHMFVRRIWLTALFIACVIGVTPARAQGLSAKSFSVTPDGTLKISLGAGNIHIATWEKGEVRINAVDNDNQLLMTQDGNTVVVKSSGDVDIQATIPSRFNIDLQCGSGDISIDGPLAGSLKGKTSGGGINLGNLSGTITMSTSGGEITGGNMRGKVSVVSAGGNLRLGNVEGDADLQTDGGDIDVKEVGKSVSASTSGGNVSVGKVGGSARLSTSGGDVEVGPVGGDCSLTSSGGNIIVHGCEAKASASTAGGDLTLENVAGSFSGSTAAGNIEATLLSSGNSKRTDGSLASGGGNIRLVVSPTISAVITARVHFTDRWQRDHDEEYITSDFPAESYHKDDQSGEIIATYRVNGGSGSITLDASMGSITIRKGAH
ncbi:MAG: hypothetical protein WB699_19465 [Bacteroidota bacterium]